MYNNNSDKNAINYKFCLSVKRNSLYWTTVKYFQGLRPAEVKDQVLTAAKAYWQPLATRYYTEDRNSLSASVINSIYRLRMQIDYLNTLSFKDVCLDREFHNFSTISINDNDASFEFRSQVNSKSFYWDILNYFQSHKTVFAESEMIIWAARAFWEPLAFTSLGFCSCESDWNHLVNSSVDSLWQHINYLKIMFADLLQSENRDVSTLIPQTPSHSDLNQGFEQNLSTDDQNKTDLLPPPVRKEVKSLLDPELAPRSDDELIGKMFGK